MSARTPRDGRADKAKRTILAERTHDATWAAAGYAILAVLATWPLVTHIGSALPGDLGDPLLNTFILGWDADRLLHGLGGWWDAPFFYPLKGTLAFSEHLLGIAFFTAPLQWLTGNAVLAYNAAMLGSYVLAGMGMYLLVRELGGHRGAAWLGGVAFALAPHRVAHVSHLQVLMSGWMPLALLGLHRYLATGSRRALAGFVVSYGLLGLANGYYIYFFSVPAIVVSLIELGRLLGVGSKPWPVRWRVAGGRAVGLVVALVILGAIFAPIAAGYLEAKRAFGLHRTLGEMTSYSAMPSDYLRVSDRLSMWRGVLPAGAGERELYPGFLSLALAAVGICASSAAWWRKSTQNRFAKGLVVVYVIVGLLAFVLSTGPHGSALYRWLLAVVPGLNGLRVPARFSVIVALALAVLAGGGAAVVLRGLRRRWAAAAAAMLTGLLVIDGYGGPLVLRYFDSSQHLRAEMHAWLRESEPGAVLYVPVGGSEGATLTFQYGTLLHRHPIVNGYSGYGYALQDFLGRSGSPLLAPEEIPELLVGLGHLGVRYIVQDRLVAGASGGLPADPYVFEDAMNAARDQVAETKRFGGAVVWRLEDPAPAQSVQHSDVIPVEAGEFALSGSPNPEQLLSVLDGDLRTGWSTRRAQTGHEWIQVEFARPRDVARIVFESTREDRVDYPRHLVVDSIDRAGTAQRLYDGSALVPLVAGIVADGARNPIVIDLPPNQSRVLQIAQTGSTTRRWWTIQELHLWRRRR
jgi:hypothetical protein